MVPATNEDVQAAMADLMVRFEAALNKGEEAAGLLAAKHELLTLAAQNTLDSLDKLIETERRCLNG